MDGPQARVDRREVASSLLIALGTLLLLLGLAATYARDTFLNPERFAGVTAEAVQRPEVRVELRRAIVDQLIAQRPPLIAARPLLEGATDSVLRSATFRRILVAAALETHRTFSTDEPTLVLDLTDLTTVVIGTLRAFAPDLAATIPPGVDAGLIAIGQRPYQQAFANAEAATAGLLILGIAGGLAAYGGALALAGDRRRGVVKIGLALAAGALLGQVALGIGQAAFVARFATPPARLAAGAVWETFAAELVAWLWLVAIGSAVIAAASGLSPHLADPQAQLAALRRRLTTLPTSPRGWLLYAGGVVAAGIFLLAAPEAALSLLARGTGLLALYLSVAVLLRLAGWSTPPAEPRRVGGATDGRNGVRALAIAALLALVIGGGVAIWGNRAALRGASIAAAAPIDRCNGHAELCDRPLDRVAFAATHNAMSAAREPGWFLAAHEDGIRRQLTDGVRGFLIDAHYGFPGTNGVATDESNPNKRALIEAGLAPETIAAARRLSASRVAGQLPGAPRETFLCHGFCELGATPLDTALGWMADFLAANPNEVLILFIEDYVTPDDVAAAFTRGRLIDEVYTHTPGAPWPTLRELIERRRRVVVLAENAAGQPRPAWFHDGWALAQDTSYSTPRPEAFDCRPNRGGAASQLFLLNHWVARQPPDPGDAAIVNARDFLLARARQCQSERGHLPNLVAVDFYQIGDLLGVIDTLNGVRDP